MKRQVAIWILLLLATPMLAQAPLGFNYQGIARQSDGTPISNQTIGIRVSITDGAQGQSQFSEEHFPLTNEFGLFTLVVGQGNGSSTLNSVDWSGGNLWLQIELDPDNTGSYILMGSQQLMSVPYALYAQQSGGGLRPGYGLDITNGTISNVLPDIPVTLTGSGNVEITGSYPNFTINGVNTSNTNGLQTISKTGSTVTLSDGGGSFTDEVDDADADATNEIQDLQLAGNILTITKNGAPTSIDLSPYLDNTDTQLTEGEVDTYVSNNGYLTNEVDGSTTNEIQDLQLVGNNLTITNNGTATTIDLSPYLDNTDTQLTESEVDTYVSNNGYLTSEVDGSTTNEIQNLSEVLTQSNNAGNTQIKNLADPTVAQDAATKNYVDAQDANLQTSVTTNTANITSESTTRATNDSNIQNELDATQTGAGLGTNGSYTADATTTYLTGAGSLKNADKLLDTQVAANESDIASNASNISTLTSRLDNTYAFHANFTIDEPSPIFKTTVSLVEDSDNFNQINSNTVTIGADGLYLIVVDAERLNSDINFSKLYIRVNGGDSNIPLLSNLLNFGRSQILILTAGDTISLVATADNTMSQPVSGSISGYKISD